MRHNAAMGVIAIASCAAVVSSTLIGPMTRLRHHSERLYSNNRRILTGVATGYIGSDGEMMPVVAAPLSSPRAQLLLADFAEKTDDTPDAGSTADPPPTPDPFPFRGPPSPGAPSGPPTPPAQATSPAAPPALQPVALPIPPAPPVPLTGGLVAVAPTKPTPPQPPPPVTPDPPPGPVVTPEPPPVVVQVDSPVIPPTPTEPSPPPPPPPPPPDGAPSPPPVKPTTTVPEPASWVSMLAGFALAGGALRRRRLAAGLGARP